MNELLKVHDRKKAVLFLIIAALLWSLGGLFIKSIQWDAISIAGVRSFFAAVLIFAFIPESRKLPKTFAIWLGSFAYAGMVITLVLATKMTTAANAIFLQYTAPIYVAIISCLFLKEKISNKDLSVIVCTGIGMVLFFIEEFSFASIVGNLLGITSGICFAIMVICFRYIKNTEPSTVPLYGNLLAFILTVGFWQMPLPNGFSILALIFLGLFQLGLPYLIYSRALKHVTPLESVLIPAIEPILNPIWVFLVVGEKPSFWAICGGLIVLTVISLYCLDKAKAKVQQV